MKKLIVILCFILSTSTLIAQETYTVNGETLQLKTEVDGKLDLLWNIINGQYRYFIRTEDNTLTELVNTKNDNKKYKEEYKTVLKNLTNNAPDKVNLTLFSLKEFVDNYNLSEDPSYKSSVYKAKPQLLLELFGGITNSPFVKNTDNIKSPQFGAELELLDGNRIKPHALFMGLRHVLRTTDFKYSSTELALGYRIRVINSEQFSLYAHTKFATLNFLKSTVPNATNGTIDITETVFDVPFTFGIGADIQLSDNSFLTIRYNELFAALLENNGHFSTNLTVGYKLKL
jgi:hypothetical protein